jgi:hypothetical protein
LRWVLGGLAGDEQRNAIESELLCKQHRASALQGLYWEATVVVQYTCKAGVGGGQLVKKQRIITK